MKPTVFIVCGLVGAGKTTTANILSKLIDVQVFSLDETIHLLFKKASNVGEDRTFSKTEIDVCYNTFALLTESLLKANSTVILDGAFFKRTQRDAIVAIAEKMQVPHYFIYVDCPEEIVKERVTKRFKEGKGVGWEARNEIKKRYEPLEKEHHTIDTSKDIEAQLKELLSKL